MAKLQQKRIVQEYTQRFKEIILDIPNMGLDEKLDKYIRGLKPILQKEVIIIIKVPTTLEDASRIVERLNTI